MGRAQFENADFLRAARELVVARGPSGVTVEAVTERLKAPTGSFYHRFASRDVLLGELWLSTVRAFQEGSIAAAAAGDWLDVALHTPAWCRAHLEEACFLLLYNRDDFLRGEWPDALKRGFDDQARQIENAVRQFAEERFGDTKVENLRRASFVLVDVPLAAVRPHLHRRERPPLLVDELIRATYDAVVGRRKSSKLSPSARTRRKAQ